MMKLLKALRNIIKDDIAKTRPNVINDDTAESTT